MLIFYEIKDPQPAATIRACVCLYSHFINCTFTFQFAQSSSQIVVLLSPLHLWVSWSLSFGAKRPQFESNYSPLYSVEFKNVWSHNTSHHRILMPEHKQIYIYIFGVRGTPKPTPL